MQLSLETPKFYGPARGLPRNREPLLHLIRNTTLLKDYEVVGAMTLDAVRTIQTPTLLVYGRDSHFISSYDFLHKALPNCKPVLLPGGEHFGPLEQPELLTEHIQQFLKKPAPVSSLPPVSFRRSGSWESRYSALVRAPRQRPVRRSDRRARAGTSAMRQCGAHFGGVIAE